MRKNEKKKLDLIKCPKCGYYNGKGYIKKYGKCNGCKNILSKEADFKYNMIKKLHLFKKGQIGFDYKQDV